MIHLTLTGRYAGTPYCEQPRNEHDRYMHLPYNMTALKNLLNDSDLCPECKMVYDESEEEDE